MSTDNRDVDPDDFFAETRMSFGDHIEDLRTHLWRALKGFFFACIIGFAIGKHVLAFIASPVEEQLQAFYDRRLKETMRKLEEGTDKTVQRANQRTDWIPVAFPADQMRDLFKDGVDKANGHPKPPDEAPMVTLWMRYLSPVEAVASLQKAQYVVGKRPALTTLSVQEAFMVYIKVSLVTGFVLGAPWIFYQIWSFIAVGLYPHEKRLVNVYMPFSIGLFIFGVLLCEFFVIPRAIEALLWFNEWIGLEPDLRLSEWLGFAIMMPLIFGISFQMPLAMLFIYRIGLMSVATFREKRRIIWFLMAVFAALITPSTDPWSMIMLWAPLCLLFELGIYLCALYPQPPSYWDKEDVDDRDWEEVIEV
jgi:sec-independent protein translocase protein TatC